MGAGYGASSVCNTSFFVEFWKFNHSIIFVIQSQFPPHCYMLLLLLRAVITPPPPPRVKLHNCDLRCVGKWYPNKNVSTEVICNNHLHCTPNGFGIDKNRVWPCSYLEMILMWPWGGTPVKRSTNPCHLSYPILYPYVVMRAEADVPHC